MAAEIETELDHLHRGEDRNKAREQFVTFQIDSEEYGVMIFRTREIIKPRRITNVPNTDDHVLGVINLRGQIVPVVDLKKKLDLDLEGRADDEEERIITVEVNEALIGIQVDGVNEVVWLEEDGIEPPPEVAGGIKQEYLRGVGRKEGRLLVLIDLESLLFQDEEKELDEDINASEGYK